MKKTDTPDTCPLHGKPLPCLSCRGAKGGRVRSEKKTKANRSKALKAALTRWGREDARIYE